MSLFFYRSDNMKKVEIVSTDRIGLVGEISKILSRINGNIITHTANVSFDGTTAVSHFIADVDLDKELDNDTLSRRLKRIKSVRQVKITDI